jgi:ethanolamine utilization protein EutN
MTLGRVVGSVWGARQARFLEGQKILKVDCGGAIRIAVDRLGAGPGDQVLVAHGSRVRDLTLGPSIPVKDVIIAIVDGVERST